MPAALRFPLPVSWAASAVVLSLPWQAVHFHVVSKHKCFSFQLFSCSHEKSMSAKQPAFPFPLPRSFPLVSFLPLLPHTLIMATQVEVVHWLRLRLVNTKKKKNKYGRKIKMINTTDYITLYLKTKGKMNLLSLQVHFLSMYNSVKKMDWNVSFWLQFPGQLGVNDLYSVLQVLLFVEW